MSLYSLIQPLLFALEPEKAHDLSLKILAHIPAFFFPKIRKNQNIQALGLKFPHPIGLAAGLDKNGDYLPALSKLGFAFIELGTVTPKPQEGNPKPRLFRLPEEKAIINRMGFNNKGVDALIANIKKANYSGILGINIGKNKDTPLDKAADDYLYSLKKVYPYASYITLNISSPNTPDLRLLQQKEYLSHLLTALVEEQQRLSDEHQRFVPLLVKLSPDEDEECLKQMAEVFLKFKIAGVIATNTTTSRAELKTITAHAKEAGGLSGKPLYAKATQCLKLLKNLVGDEMTLIGVGGIEDSSSAKEKLEAGATLLQVYTGLIYQGPGLVKDLVEGIEL